MLVNLTQGKIDKIQIDEGIVVINYGEATGEMMLGPTRGGAELTITPSIRDIEYDGKVGKTKGLQVKDGEDVSLKIKTLDCSQETLNKALVNAIMNETTKDIEQGDFGLVAPTNYLKNVAVITKMLDGKFKVLIVKNAMHEGAFSFKTAPKAENEHNLEFLGHYNPLDITEKIYKIMDLATMPIIQ